MSKQFVVIEDRALKKQMQKAMQRNPRQTARAVMACVLDLAGKSANRAPIESGDLRNNCHGAVGSITVYENMQKNTGEALPRLRVSGTVGYSLPYALRQHEELNYRHDRTDGKSIIAATRHKTENGKVTTYSAASTVNKIAGGEAKFLERPYLENISRYVGRFKKIPEECVR